MLHKKHVEIKALCVEVKELSDYIFSLKRKKNVMADEMVKNKLHEEIKQRQYQTLFYIDKINNL